MWVPWIMCVAMVSTQVNLDVHAREYLEVLRCEEKYKQLAYVSKKCRTPAADFLINISSLDILKTLLHQWCRS